MAINRIPDRPTVSQPMTPAGTDARLEIDGARSRQTERPAAPFRSVLSGGASLLLAGAEVATHVVGGPILAAAVHDARVSATAAIAGPAVVPGGAGVAAAAGAGGGEAVSMQAMMQEGQASNLQLLALQQQVQQENQTFSTLSNVVRAKHDTAKAAVSNIRA
jgi:hypothetical protein